MPSKRFRPQVDSLESKALMAPLLAEPVDSAAGQQIELTPTQKAKLYDFQSRELTRQVEQILRSADPATTARLMGMDYFSDENGIVVTIDANRRDSASPRVYIPHGSGTTLRIPVSPLFDTHQPDPGTVVIPSEIPGKEIVVVLPPVLIEKLLPPVDPPIAPPAPTSEIPQEPSKNGTPIDPDFHPVVPPGPTKKIPQEPSGQGTPLGYPDGTVITPSGWIFVPDGAYDPDPGTTNQYKPAYPSKVDLSSREANMAYNGLGSDPDRGIYKLPLLYPK